MHYDKGMDYTEYREIQILTREKQLFIKENIENMRQQAL